MSYSMSAEEVSSRKLITRVINVIILYSYRFVFIVITSHSTNQDHVMPGLYITSLLDASIELFHAIENRVESQLNDSHVFCTKAEIYEK